MNERLIFTQKLNRELTFLYVDARRCFSSGINKDKIHTYIHTDKMTTSAAWFWDKLRKLSCFQTSQCSGNHPGHFLLVLLLFICPIYKYFRTTTKVHFTPYSVLTELWRKNVKGCRARAQTPPPPHPPCLPLVGVTWPLFHTTDHYALSTTLAVDKLLSTKQGVALTKQKKNPCWLCFLAIDWKLVSQ